MRGNRVFPAGLVTLAIAGLAAVLVVVPWGSGPAVLADSSSIEFDLELICSGAPTNYDCTVAGGSTTVDPGDHPSVQTKLKVDPGGETPDEPFVDLTNTLFRGLTPAHGKVITDGDRVGTMEFSIESNLIAPGGSNIFPLTGQPPVCGVVGAATLGATLNIFDADLGTSDDENVHDLGEGLVSERDLDGDGYRETEEDNFLADGTYDPDGNGLDDGIDLLPDALANYLIPSLGLGFPIGRSFGVATLGLGVTMDVNLLLYHLGGGEYLNLTILGYPGVPTEQPSAANLTNQTVITCPPFASTVLVFGVTQGNPAYDVDGDTAPDGIPGGVANRTALEGTHDYKIIVSSGDNYDGDEAASPYDSCPAVVSEDTDLVSEGNQDPDQDRWDSACDPVPGSANNDDDGTLGPYNMPVVGTFPSVGGGCPDRASGNWECDQDVDGDTFLNTVDNCPLTPDADVDRNGMEDGTGPVDPGTGDCNDGVDNDEDTLVDGEDPQCLDFIDWQLDSDADTVGDVCDAALAVKGDGSGYATDAHPHDPAEPGGYADHDRICNDKFTVPGTEPAGGAGCVSTVDSGNDGDPDFVDENSSGAYNIGEPIDVDSDADGDGHTDACEAVSDTDPLDDKTAPGPPAVPDANPYDDEVLADCDGDGASDEKEEALKSNPFVFGVCSLPFVSIVASDSDCDGAPDAAELGPNQFLCGTRNPNNPWDFYNVPVPTLGNGGTMGDRDSAVTILSDVLAVLEYSGTSDDGPPNSVPRDYDDDQDGDGYDDGIAYDRSATGAWSGPADGAVTILADVLLVLAQSGAGC